MECTVKSLIDTSDYPTCSIRAINELIAGTPLDEIHMPPRAVVDVWEVSDRYQLGLALNQLTPLLTKGLTNCDDMINLLDYCLRRGSAMARVIQGIISTRMVAVLSARDKAAAEPATGGEGQVDKIIAQWRALNDPSIGLTQYARMRIKTLPEKVRAEILNAMI